MTQQDLLSLARSGAIADVEDVWRSALEDPGDVGVYCAAVDALCESDARGPALELATAMVDALAERSRHADAIALAHRIIAQSAHSDSFAKSAFELIESHFAQFEWYGLIRSLSGLGEDNLSDAAFVAFERARCFTPGHALYHPAGWGEGIVEELDCTAEELRIRFASGRVQELPLSSALDSLRPLEPDDLRSMRLLRRDELAELAERAPAVLVRKAAKLYRGRITSAQVKAELSPAVVPTKRWASFWKRAKADAATDPWLQVEGTPTRPVFVLRKQPLSLVDEAARTISHCRDLAEVIAACREHVVRNQDPSAQRTILELCREQVEAAISRQREGDTSIDPAQLLDGILLLEQHGLPTSMSAAEEVRTLVSDAEAGFDAAALGRLDSQAAQEHAVALLPQALGDAWAEVCVAAVTAFPQALLESLVTALQEARQAHLLLPVWTEVAPYPRRYPVLIFQLARLYAEGAFDDAPNKPDLLSVCRVQMHLARIVTIERRGNQDLLRIRPRLTSLLTGRRALLTRCLEDIEREDLAAFLGIAERAGSEFPQEITAAILRTIARRFPDLTSKPERAFWDRDDRIYVTAAGLQRQREEYRVLVDEKIPANSRAIGAAASLGDLSENSEWDAAMEEQRNLTTRATDMERELKMARPLEDADIPSDVVAPGTRFSYRTLDSDQVHSLTVLGPWDAVDGDEGTINYRAPLARAFLGKKVGEEGQMPSISGPRPYRVESIERVI